MGWGKASDFFLLDCVLCVPPSRVKDLPLRLLLQTDSLTLRRMAVDGLTGQAEGRRCPPAHAYAVRVSVLWAATAAYNEQVCSFSSGFLDFCAWWISCSKYYQDYSSHLRSTSYSFFMISPSARFAPEEDYPHSTSLCRNLPCAVR